jgi:hypothetical protein
MARGPFVPGSLLRDDRPGSSVCAYTVLSSIISDVMLLTSSGSNCHVTDVQLLKARHVYHALTVLQEVQ